MTHESVARVLQLAGRHHGLVRTDVLASAGIGRGTVARLTAAGVLERFGGQGIRRVAGGPPTAHQRLLGAVWASGPLAAASHRSAAWLWDLDPISQLHLPVDVAVPPDSGRRPAGVVLHYQKDLTRRIVTTVDGIPVVEPTLTLVDLGLLLDPDDLECAVDSALRQGLTTPARFETIVRRYGRRGRNGIGPFRAMVEARAAIDGITDTMFETRLVQVLRRGGLPEPVRQLSLHDDAGFVGRFDCAYPEARVLIEADSVRHHHDRARFESDRERRTRAEALGWRVPTFTWRQLTHRPRYVVSATAAILDASGWDWRRAA